MHPIESLLGPVEPMMHEIITGAESDGLDLSLYVIDHVCYKVETLTRYTELMEKFASYGKCLSEYVIGGRPVATFLLNEPIKSMGFEIECVELPAPKAGHPSVDGWEHIECALGIPPQKFAEKYPNVHFDTANLVREINPHMSVQYGPYVLKFHEHTLRYVVEVLQA